MVRNLQITLAVVTSLVAGMAAAQGTDVSFGALKQDTMAPVEITADQLSVDQKDGSAVFRGNVLIGQGQMRLSAGEVRVEYAEGDGATTGQIERLIASGGVTLATATEAAEAQNADYTIESGKIVMTGDVILTQGQNALSSERLVVDLKSGTGQMDGRVKTILNPGSQ